MNKNKLAFFLGIIAGLLALSACAYRYFHAGIVDYTTLFAGIFILAFGLSRRYKRIDI